MRGTILGYESFSSEDVINDSSGGRIKFVRADWKGPGEPIAAGRWITT